VAEAHDRLIYMDIKRVKLFSFVKYWNLIFIKSITMKKANRIAMIIGVIGIVNGLIQVYQGQKFQDYFFSLFIGITLFGTAYFNYKELQNTKK
jgi:hypothetical protein